MAFYEKPLLKLDRLLETYLATAPFSLRSFLRSMPLWLKQKAHVGRELARGLGPTYTRRFVFPEHHLSHAASAFLPSPFEEAAILTLDGVGEWATASVGRGQGNQVRLLEDYRDLKGTYDKPAVRDGLLAGLADNGKTARTMSASVR